MQVMFDPPAADADHKTQQQAIGDRHRDCAPFNYWKPKYYLTSRQAYTGTDHSAK